MSTWINSVFGFRWDHRRTWKWLLLVRYGCFCLFFIIERLIVKRFYLLWLQLIETVCHKIEQLTNNYYLWILLLLWWWDNYHSFLMIIKVIINANFPNYDFLVDRVFIFKYSWIVCKNYTLPLKLIFITIIITRRFSVKPFG